VWYICASHMSCVFFSTTKNKIATTMIRFLVSYEAIQLRWFIIKWIIFYIILYKIYIYRFGLQLTSTIFHILSNSTIIITVYNQILYISTSMRFVKYFRPSMKVDQKSYVSLLNGDLIILFYFSKLHQRIILETKHTHSFYNNVNIKYIIEGTPITLISRKLLKTNPPQCDHVEQSFWEICVSWSIKSKLDMGLSNLKLFWSVDAIRI